MSGGKGQEFLGVRPTKRPNWGGGIPRCKEHSLLVHIRGKLLLACEPGNILIDPMHCGGISPKCANWFQFITEGGGMLLSMLSETVVAFRYTSPG